MVFQMLEKIVCFNLGRASGGISCTYEMLSKSGGSSIHLFPIGRLFAIAGCTNTGKTTIAKILAAMLIEECVSVTIIHQDEFFYTEEKVEKIWRGCDSEPNFFHNYDCKSAIDHKKLIHCIKSNAKRYDFVIVEGNMLTEWDDIIELCDRVIFLTLDQVTCRQRRNDRKYDPPDTPGYFDEVVWPAYQLHLQKALALARENRRISFLDVTPDKAHLLSDPIVPLILAFLDVIHICHYPLDVGEVLRLINSPTCGATSIFVGSTRDTFNGRVVARLDYDSYDSMAHKELRKLCLLIREEYPSVERVVIMHRVGEVAVGEISVIIATASPHRKDAIHATEMAIDRLKKSVPIWKKEVYEDGGCSWKENSEGCTNGNSTARTDVKGSVHADRTRDRNWKLFWLRLMIKQMNYNT